MDFDPPAPEHPYRSLVRAWLAEHPHPTPRALAEAGLVAPHWPAPYGRDAAPLEQLIIDEELHRAGVRRPDNPIGIGWAGPTLLAAGTAEQQARFLLPLLAGEEVWCQLFSEPDAGSDLAALRTTAARDGDGYRINGTKIWTTGGHRSQFGILIARTDGAAPKHKGITYFVCPMDLPGITLAPIVDMTRAHSFNQVFFDDVRIPASLRVGAEGEGWRLARVTLANERTSLSSGGSLWGMGPTAAHLLDLVRRAGGTADPRLRQLLARLHTESELLRLMRLRTLTRRLAGRAPGPEASIQKLLGDEHGQAVMALAKELAGTAGMLEGSGPPGPIPPGAAMAPTEIHRAGPALPDIHPIWHYGFLFSPALTIGGGTWAVQRNIVAERVLGLPREPSP